LDGLKTDTCQIKRAILHHVDRARSGPTRAEAWLSLTSEVEKFLVGHVIESLKDCNAAVFDDRDANAVSSCCKTLLSSEDELVPQSQELARQLHGCMRHPRIARGTLCVAVIADRVSGTTFVALLKLDDSSSWTRKEFRKDGKLWIEMEMSDRGLPAVEEKIDKAAFIVPTGYAGDEYDLKLLDRRRRRTEVAMYFEEFLGCRAARSDREKTRMFSREFENWLQSHKDELPGTLTEHGLREMKRSYLDNHDQIQVAAFAEAAFGDRNPELQISLTQHFRANKLVDASFTVDLPEQARKTTLRFTRGDKRIDVKGAWDAVKGMVRFDRVEDDGTGVRAIIEADGYVEIPS